MNGFQGTWHYAELSRYFLRYRMPDATTLPENTVLKGMWNAKGLTNTDLKSSFWYFLGPDLPCDDFGNYKW